MRHFFRYILISFLFIGVEAKAQSLPDLCDSIFKALKYEKFDSLKKFIPTYKQLSATYDSLDMERQAQQILISQKSMVISLRRSFKSLTKQAKAIKMPLKKMEMEDLRHIVQSYDGKKYSNVEIDCRYRNRGGTLYFTVIKLNDNWYLGEDLRILKREVEETPNYEKIDRDLERRQEKREQTREKNRQKAIQDSIKREKQKIIAAEKAKQDSLKQLKIDERKRKRAVQDSLKAEKKRKLAEKKAAKKAAKKKRAEEKARKKALREAERKHKKEEAEKKKQETTKPKEENPPQDGGENEKE